MCIFDLSKVLINEIYYDYIKNKCDNNSRALFTHTDNLMYEGRTRDVCKDFSKDREMFDFANYTTKSTY